MNKAISLTVIGSPACTVPAIIGRKSAPRESQKHLRISLLKYSGGFGGREVPRRHDFTRSGRRISERDFAGSSRSAIAVRSALAFTSARRAAASWRAKTRYCGGHGGEQAAPTIAARFSSASFIAA